MRTIEELTTLAEEARTHAPDKYPAIRDELVERLREQATMLVISGLKAVDEGNLDDARFLGKALRVTALEIEDFSGENVSSIIDVADRLERV